MRENQRVSLDATGLFNQSGPTVVNIANRALDSFDIKLEHGELEEEDKQWYVEMFVKAHSDDYRTAMWLLGAQQIALAIEDLSRSVEAVGNV